MQIGIFGGTFDPVHYGHLLLAETCREALPLDEVWFTPAAISPHKQQRPPTPAAQRVEMLRLAIGGHEAFQLCLHEIERGEVSYTLDTLEAIHRERPADDLFLLMGADTLADLPRWRGPQRVLELALPVCVGRPHRDDPAASRPDYAPLAPLLAPERLAAARQAYVEMPWVELSASEIRRRVAAGRSIRYRTPRAVEKYIESAQLYRE